MGVPSAFVNQQAQEHPYAITPLLSHDQSLKFEMKVLPIYFIMMLDDTNWDTRVMSPPSS